MGDAPATAASKPCCVCDAPGGKHCTKCKSRHYCSKKCQLVDWKEGGHKEQCKQLAAKFQDRLLDELMPAKKVKEEPAIVADVAPAAGLKARLSAVGLTATAAAKAGAPSDDAPDWRGTCAVCMDLLPIEIDRIAFYTCCCKKICTECSYKCAEYDKRCPLCREPNPKSDAEWLRRLQKHVDNGNDEAQIALGNTYSVGEMGLKKSVKRAFELYELAAAQGNGQGQAQLGECYQRGDSVKINLKTAAQWYRRAADQGYPDAQSNLGGLFYHGKGVAQSYDEAVKLFRLAAAQGDADALFNLGGCYFNGHGVPRDYDEALRLCKRAAAKGHAYAAEMAAEVEAHMSRNS